MRMDFGFASRAAAGAENDHGLLLSLLADIRVNQEDLLRSQVQVVHRLDTIERDQARLRRYQGQVTNRFQQLQIGQNIMAREMAAMAAGVRIHQAYVARQHVCPRHSAGKRVADSAKLLERILLPLHMKDVLLAQRVSKQFKEVIKGSEALQCKLFIRAEPFDWTGNGPIIRINPLLGKIVTHKQVVFNIDGYTGATKESSLVQLPNREMGYGVPSDYAGQQLCIRFIGDERKHPCNVKPDVKYETWRWMLATQPPIDVEAYFNGAAVTKQDNVKRLGDLADWFPESMGRELVREQYGPFPPGMTAEDMHAYGYQDHRVALEARNAYVSGLSQQGPSEPGPAALPSVLPSVTLGDESEATGVEQIAEEYESFLSSLTAEDLLDHGYLGRHMPVEAYNAYMSVLDSQGPGEAGPGALS